MSRWSAAMILAATILIAGTRSQAASPFPGAVATPPGGALRPAGNEAPVAVITAEVRMDLRAPEGRVHTAYRLRSTADQPLELAIAFPAPPWVMGEWKVGATLDGRAFPVQTSLGPVVHDAEELVVQPTWLDPFDGEPYFPVSAGEPLSPQFLVFPVAFDPGQERDLTVDLYQLPSEDAGRLLEPIRRFDYLLQPARHWASFGPLRLEVLAPDGVAVRSLLPLTPTGGGRYVAELPRLPTGNLAIFLAPGPGPRWWWSRAGRSWLLVLTAAGSAVLAALAAVSERPWVRRGSLPISLLTWASLYFLAPPHLLRPDPTGVLFLWVLAVPALMVMHIIIRGLVLRVHPRRRWPPLA